jgi:hypothetical protein
MKHAHETEGDAMRTDPTAPYVRFSDPSVFGVGSGGRVPPRWIADDAAVGRRITAKRDDQVGAEVWWHIAEAVRRCVELTGEPRLPIASAKARVRATVAALVALDAAASGADLPLPQLPVCAWPPVRPQSLHDLRAFGPRTDLVDEAAAELCVALDAPAWTCPHALAGRIDDLRLVVHDFARNLVALAAAPPRQRMPQRAIPP